jgi:hypothetical protein
VTSAQLAGVIFSVPTHSEAPAGVAGSFFHLASNITAVDLGNLLGDVETDSCNRLHDWHLRIVGGLNSTYIHGTHVPAKEPSTAS